MRKLFPVVLIVALVALTPLLASLLSPQAEAALVQLQNDNNTAAGYTDSWQAGIVVGAVLTPESSMYPVRVSSVEFVLYQFAGASNSATVRVCIYSVANGRPSARLGCSSSATITTFFPNLVSLGLGSSEIIIRAPDTFMAAVEYMAGTQGTTPSTLTDSNTNIPQGKNYYSGDGGNTWYEHYEVWSEPGQTGFNIIRATVDTNYGTSTPTPTSTHTPVRIPTETPTPILTSTPTNTPVPQATAFTCGSSARDVQVYLPQPGKQAQSVSTRPFGSGVLGAKEYWPYSAISAGNHQVMVNLSNGNLLVTHTDQDIPAPGIDSFLFRTYNGLSPYTGDFGAGWTSNVGNTVRLSAQSDGAVVFFGPSGEVESFDPDAGGFVAPPGFHYGLEHHADATYTITSISGGIEFNFDSRGQLTSVTDRNGNTQSYRRDAGGNVIEILDTVGGSTAIAYNDAGLVTSITDRAGRVSRYDYGSAGRLAHYVDPAGHSTEYRYDACGNLTELVDAAGNHWFFRYNTGGRIVAVTDPLGHRTQFTYGEGTTIVTDANRHSAIYNYDGGGKLQEEVDANNQRTRFTWDQYLNLTDVISPLGHEMHLGWYGNTGLLASVTDAQGNVMSYVYDAYNNPSSVTDARGNVTQFSYDGAGANLLSMTYPDGGRVTFTYDSRGNPLTMVDPNGNAGDPSNPTGIPYRYAYNTYGYLADAYDPLGNHWTYTWDNNPGNLLSQRDAKGQLTQYTYDVLDRLTGITYADSTTVGFTYNALGDLTSMADSHGTTTYTYDAVGQVLIEDDPRTAGAIQYNYDPVGNVISVIRENGAVLSFIYDPTDRLIGQSNPFAGTQFITYGYDAGGRLVRISYPNGDRTTYGYYPNGWLASLLTTASDGTVYDRYEYPSQAAGGYDASGNPLRFTRTFATFDAQGAPDWTTETWVMSYDPMDRLAGQDTYNADGAWEYSVTFSYDPNGLWATRTYRDSTRTQSWDYHYDAAARWIGVSFWDGRHDVIVNDADGNQTQIKEEFLSGTTSAADWRFSSSLLNGPSVSPLLGPSPDQTVDRVLATSAIVTNTTTFEYDAADRLIKVTDPRANWYAFEYDGFDRMVKESGNLLSSPKYQYYDLLGMARETQDSTTVNYLYDLAGNVRSGTLEGTQPYYLHRDPRDQITHVSDELLLAYDYCPVGNVQAGGAAVGTTVYEPFLSTGLYTVDLQDTWQAGIFMQVSGGEFWPHNSQLTTRNSLAGAAAGGGGGQPPDPPQKMKASPAIAGPGVTVCAASPFEDDCNPDDDDDDPKDSWWRRLFERVKRWFREKVRWQKYTLQFRDRGRWVIKLNKFTGRDTVSRAEAIKRFWHKYFPRKEPHGHEIWKNFRKIYVRDPNGKVWFP